MNSDHQQRDLATGPISSGPSSLNSGGTNHPRSIPGDLGFGICPVCAGGLIEIRGKLQCGRCHTICETCCEGGPG